MFEVIYGCDYTPARFVKFTEALAFAIFMGKNGWECDVASLETGEVLVTIREGEIPYIADCITAIV